jgi:two-component system, OmpR family, sensor kinase
VPLRLRLTLLFTLGTAGVLFSAGVIFFLQLRASLTATVDTTLTARSEALASRLASTPAAGRGAAVAAVEGSDEFAQVLATNGTVIVTSASAGRAPLVTGRLLSAARAGQTRFTTVLRDRSSRVMTVPARSGGQPVIAVVGVATEFTDVAEDHVRDIMVFATGPAVVITGLAAWALSGAALRPVERMRRQAAEISEHDPTLELAVPATRDEVAALGHTLNGMLRRLRAALERERGFVADASHELRSPLTNLKAELELAARPGRSARELSDAVANAAEETDRLIRLAEALLLLARYDDPAAAAGVTVALPVHEVLEPAVAAARSRAGTRDVTVTLETDPDTVVRADPDRLRQAVDNLLANALRYAPPGSRIAVTARRHGDDPAAEPAGGGLPAGGVPGGLAGAGWVSLEIADRGPGFPPTFLPHAFERFRRADPARTRSDGGAGLGLAIVASVAAAHGGHAVALNRPDGGAAVRITLPACP